jgi:hypothetical protein
LKDPNQFNEIGFFGLFHNRYVSLFHGKPKELIRKYNLLRELANKKYPILKKKLEEII